MNKSKRIRIHNVPDIKDLDGLWVKSYSTVPNLSHGTRSGDLWASLKVRCKVGGALQQKSPTYIGVMNEFAGFQEFTDWCQSQYGYLNKNPNGTFWQLDKDLKVEGSKVYSPETCLFVPSKINSILTSCAATRGEYPIGVSWQKSRSKFTAYCSDGSQRKQHLGCFIDPLVAHKAWQKYKVTLLRDLVANDESIAGYTELQSIILNRADKIENDLILGIETL